MNSGCHSPWILWDVINPYKLAKWLIIHIP
jgi:hypothetical protein